MTSQKNRYTPIKHMNVPKHVLEKLQHQGIKYTRQLLECGQTHQLRETLASATGLSLAFITLLVYHADLMRLKAVGGQLALLLLHAGITTCQALQHQQAEDLHRRLALLNERHHIVWGTPKVVQVRSWINEAKLLADTSPETSSLELHNLTIFHLHE